MNILIIADTARFDEMQTKLGHTIKNNLQVEFGKLQFTHLHAFSPEIINQIAIDKQDLIIDLLFDTYPDSISFYNQEKMEGKTILLHSVCYTLHQALAQYSHHKNLYAHIIGINALPTFINRPLWELSLPITTNQTIQATDNFCKKWGIDYRLCDDRVGMITPRIVSMIINEAYFLLQERGAALQDIDDAMLYGVNYPMGPFEWAKRIGLQNIVNTLQAVYNDTNDERYRLCPLLKKQALISTNN